MLLFYYPNRPTLIPPDPNNPIEPKPDYINSLEKKKIYVAEQKWNGDNVCIHTSGLIFYNRRGQKHSYIPTKEVKDQLETFPKQSILNAELLHYKIKDPKYKNLIIVHSLLAWKGNLLTNKTWGDARDILEQQEYGSQVRLSPIWKSGFWELFQKADGEIIEGIILKDPTGKIIISATKIPDVTWMFKIRKPCKKYSF